MNNYTDDELMQAILFLDCVSSQYAYETMMMTYYSNMPMTGSIDKVKVRDIEQCQRMFPNNELIANMREQIDALKPVVPVSLLKK